MVVAATVLDLLVVSVDLKTDLLWLAEVEWSALNLEDLTCWDADSINREIEVSVKLEILILDSRCRLSNTAE